MTANPLVAGPVDTSTAFGGAGVLESVTDLCSSLESGSWVAVGLAGVGAALDVAATVIDPLGSLIGAGLGWLMEHLEPLKGWLNDLTGDAGAVLGFAGTWQNVADAMGAAGDELTRVVRADLEAMTGASIAAYAAYADGLADRIRATGGSASAIGGALKTCAMVVQVVHDLVRDTLASLVGSIISWAAEAVFTLGLATPVIVGQVSTRVSSLATKVGPFGHRRDLVGEVVEEPARGPAGRAAPPGLRRARQAPRRQGARRTHAPASDGNAPHPADRSRPHSTCHAAVSSRASTRVGSLDEFCASSRRSTPATPTGMPPTPLRRAGSSSTASSVKDGAMNGWPIGALTEARTGPPTSTLLEQRAPAARPDAHSTGPTIRNDRPRSWRAVSTETSHAHASGRPVRAVRRRGATHVGVERARAADARSATRTSQLRAR